MLNNNISLCNTGHMLTGVWILQVDDYSMDYSIPYI